MTTENDLRNALADASATLAVIAVRATNAATAQQRYMEEVLQGIAALAVRKRNEYADLATAESPPPALALPDVTRLPPTAMG